MKAKLSGKSYIGKRTARILGEDNIPLLERLIDTLETEPDLVKRQIAIELLTAWWAMQDNRKDALTVVAGINKHVTQLVNQTWDELEKQ